MKNRNGFVSNSSSSSFIISYGTCKTEELMNNIFDNNPKIDEFIKDEDEFKEYVKQNFMYDDEDENKIINIFSESDVYVSFDDWHPYLTSLIKYFEETRDLEITYNFN